MSRDLTIRDILWMLRRAALPIIAAALLCAAITYIASPADAEPSIDRYTCSADFQIAASDPESPVESSVSVIPTFISVLDSAHYRTLIGNALGVSDSDTSDYSASLEQIAGTSVLRVNISAPTPEQCTAVSEAYSEVISDAAANAVRYGVVTPLGMSEPVGVDSSAGAMGRLKKSVIAGIIALIIAAIAAIIWGVIRPVMDDEEDSSALYGVECIGTADSKAESGYSYPAAKLSLMRGNMLSNIGHPIIMVTDCGDGAGRDAARGISKAFSAAGMNTALVDPFSAPEQPAENDSDALPEIAAPTENLRMIISDEATALLKNPTEENSLAALAAQYDNIVVYLPDAPSDPAALILGDKCDIPVIAARLHKTAHSAFAQAAKNIHGAKSIFIK